MTALGGLLKAWFRALRAHFLTATVAPVLVGTGAAWYVARSFDLLPFVLALVGGALVHLGANMSNDYFDWKSETDNLNTAGSEYSGGSRVIQEGLIPARQILTAALACISVGSVIGIVLVVKLRSIPLLLIGMAGVFFAYSYTGAPFRLGYKGFAEILNGLSFGPVIALGSFAVQAPLWSTTALLASIPPGFLLALLLVINEFPDHDSDRAAGKRTIVVILGKRRALAFYQAGLGVPFVLVAALVLGGLFPAWTLLSLASFPFAVRAFAVSRAHYDDPARVVGANMATFFLHISFNLLLALGLFLG
jgi:1,4-dihydroxy-2-naphthoate octaprenyltransferase